MWFIWIEQVSFTRVWSLETDALDSNNTSIIRIKTSISESWKFFTLLHDDLRI